MRILGFVASILAAISLGTFAASARSTETLEQTVDYLIQYVTDSDATFFRNGSLHTPAEAARHIRLKYAYFKKEIATPEDFIRLSASKSLLTGEFYLVRLPNGKEIRLDKWLTEVLAQHRNEK